MRVCKLDQPEDDAPPRGHTATINQTPLRLPAGTRHPFCQVCCHAGRRRAASVGLAARRLRDACLHCGYMTPCVSCCLPLPRVRRGGCATAEVHPLACTLVQATRRHRHARAAAPHAAGRAAGRLSLHSVLPGWVVGGWARWDARIGSAFISRLQCWAAVRQPLLPACFAHLLTLHTHPSLLPSCRLLRLRRHPGQPAALWSGSGADGVADALGAAPPADGRPAGGHRLRVARSGGAGGAGGVF